MRTNNNPEFRLPEPDADAFAHSERVARTIGEEITAAGGSISFAEYMQRVLYSPGLGYYVAGNRKFGAGGDFVTAPEVSPLFGNILARQCAETLRTVAGSEILEFGAGSGVLAVTVLRRLETLNALPERYLILEVSAELQQRQRQRVLDEIPDLAKRVIWISEVPEEFCGVMIANEVADALPFERFQIRDGQICQQRVTLRDNQLAISIEPAPELLRTAVTEIQTNIGMSFAEGYTSEVSLGLGAWVTDFCQRLRCGTVFIFDYGLSQREYYAADRSTGWLRCHYQHYAHENPLLFPGIQDITTWVDFSTVAKAAAAAGVAIAGYVTQANFLLSGGIDEEVGDFASMSTEQQVSVSGQVKLLTLPSEMGENFKCIGLQKGDVAVPEAFLHADRSQSL